MKPIHLPHPSGRVHVLALLLALAALAALPATPAPAAAQGQQACGSSPSANPGAGPLCGFSQPVTTGGGVDSVSVFLGIPYAQPPQRFQNPMQMASWTSPRQATQFGNACMQASPVVVGSSPSDTLPRSEDCLYLNVWTPAAASPGDALPVMVFIHGGAFVEGSAALPAYDGSYLAASGNVVVVTINYRLGAFGFLRYRDASGTLAGGGNAGLLDQQMALQWVQQNIGAFGGAPSRVTIFGESAGAMSVGLHLFSVPSSANLFQAAIMESNPMGLPYRDTVAAQTRGAVFATTLCRNAPVCTADSLQTATPARIMQAQAEYASTFAIFGPNQLTLETALPWTPVLDGTLVISQPFQGFAAGTTPKPFIFGMNRDEGVVFAAMAQQSGALFLGTYLTLLPKMFPGESGQIRTYAEYAVDSVTPTAPLNKTASALSNVINDFAFDCGNLAAADASLQAIAAAGLAVYAYRFEQQPFFNSYPAAATESACVGQRYSNVCHGYELPYVFNNLTAAQNNINNLSSAIPTASDSTLAVQMAQTWTRFATNPSAPPAAGWSPYTTASDSLYTWGGPSTGTMQSGLSQSANCQALWNTIPPLGPSSATRRPARTR